MIIKPVQIFIFHNKKINGGDGGIRTLAPQNVAYCISSAASYNHLSTSPKMELLVGIEPTTSSLPWMCSTY